MIYRAGGERVGNKNLQILSPGENWGNLSGGKFSNSYEDKYNLSVPLLVICCMDMLAKILPRRIAMAWIWFGFPIMAHVLEAQSRVWTQWRWYVSIKRWGLRGGC